MRPRVSSRACARFPGLSLAGAPRSVSREPLFRVDRWCRRRREAAADALAQVYVRGMQLAMPLFTDITPPAPAQVRAAWAELFPRGPHVTTGDARDRVDEYVIDGARSVAVAHIPAPVPNDEALAAVRSSWMWQGPDAPVPSHPPHSIVTALHRYPPIAAASHVARVCAVLLAASDGAGLYC